MASPPVLRRSCRLKRRHDISEPGSKSLPQPAKRAKVSNLVHTYQYNMLDKHSSQIRLFELLPGAKDDPIRARLRTVDLKTNPKYDAVSYVWGNPQPRFTLEIDNDEPLIIPENLRNALVGLRLRRGSRILWVDAICINQQDLQERGHQVGIMGDIYRSARLVRVWLDVDVNPRSAAFRMALRLEGPGTDWLFGKSRRQEPLLTVALADYDPKFWRPLYQLFENPYWERVWTQQEYFLAKKLQFHLPRGTLAPEPLIRFDEAVKLSRMIITNDKPLLPVSYQSKLVGRLFTSLYAGFKAMRWREDRPSRQKDAMLIDLFLNSTELTAADPRDHVYALIGMATDCVQGDIEPDYSMPPSLVYQQVIQHYVRKHQSIDFLCHTGYGHDHSLPSWLPSITKRSKIYVGGTPAAITPHWVEFRIGALAVRGIKCDTIAGRGMPRLCFQPILQWSKVLEDLLEVSKWTEEEAVLRLLNAWASDRIYPYVFERSKRTLIELSQSLSDLLTFVAERCPGSTVDDLAQYGKPGESGLSNDLFQLARLLRLTLNFSAFVKTGGKRLGLCHSSCDLPECQPHPGDEVWILFGCRSPVILRPRPQQVYRYHSSKLYSVIGYSDFPGLMTEECEGLLPDGSLGQTYQGLPPELINLV